MKKLISYVLFGPDHYWYNMPWILVSNSVIYPEFHMRFYIHKENTGAHNFQMLEEVSKRFPHVEIEVLETPYEGTQLTVWRMKPLWENDVEILLCRDLDHITNVLERKAVQYFLDHNQFLIHGIRSYSLHSIPYLAGLCGFRCQQIQSLIKNKAKTFEEYVQWGRNNIEYCSDWRWGCDQALMKNFFDKGAFSRYSLDCPQYTARRRVVQYLPTTAVPLVYENIETPCCDKDCLKFSESIAPPFTGQPCNANPDDVKIMIEKADNEMGEIVSKYL